MATSSSSSGFDSIADADLDDELFADLEADLESADLSYGALVGRGLDMNVLLTEFFAYTGADGIRTVTRAVGDMPLEISPYEAIEGVGALEDLKSCANAVQAEIACAHEEAVITDRTRRGVMAKNPQQGIGADVAMARHEAPRSGTRELNYSRMLCHSLPFTKAGLKYGVINDAEARIIYRVLKDLDEDARRELDARVLVEDHACFGLGGKKLESLLRHWALAYQNQREADEEAKAIKERYVQVYPIDEHRMKIIGIVPTEVGMAIAQVLARETARAQAAGDPRNAAQIAADTVLESLTGIKDLSSFPVTLELVMTDRSLIQGHPEPAQLKGYGVISAQKARKLFAGNPATPLGTWVRRLYTAPGTGDLIAMDHKARLFTGGLKRFITTRDQFCRTPYCTGKIQHLDHVVQVVRGGKTCAENGGGRCRWCNATKEAPDWSEIPVPGDRHSIRITTSSGHSYRSSAPPMPGTEDYAVHPIDSPPAPRTPPHRRQ